MKKQYKAPLSKPLTMTAVNILASSTFSMSDSNGAYSEDLVKEDDWDEDWD